MPEPSASESGEVARLQSKLKKLQESVQEMESQRQYWLRRRRRRMLFVCASLSLLCHIALMIYLSTIYVAPGSVGAAAEITYEFAIIDEQELAEMEEAGFEGDIIEEPLLQDAYELESEVLDPASPEIDMHTAASGSIPRLAGSGEGSSPGVELGGGGGSASFFGIGSKGSRFAYIVDVSGSMGQDGKMEIAMRELSRSIEALPDFAEFFVVLFASNATEPPMQRGWTRARRNIVRQYIQWLNSVEPTGGTNPRPAFYEVFSLEQRPDVIYFLTDGRIQDFSAREIVDYNTQGRKAVVNTIAFGDPSSQDLLKEIARQTGGVYRFVSPDGR